MQNGGLAESSQKSIKNLEKILNGGTQSHDRKDNSINREQSAPRRMLGANKIVSDIEIYQNSLILTGTDTPIRNHQNGLLGNPISLLKQRLMTPSRNEKKQQRLISTSINPSRNNEKEAQQLSNFNLDTKDLHNYSSEKRNTKQRPHSI